MKAALLSEKEFRIFRENFLKGCKYTNNLHTRFDEIFCKPLAPKFQTKFQQLTENFEMTTILNNG